MLWLWPFMMHEVLHWHHSKAPSSLLNSLCIEYTLRAFQPLNSSSLHFFANAQKIMSEEDEVWNCKGECAKHTSHGLRRYFAFFGSPHKVLLHLSTSEKKEAHIASMVFLFFLLFLFKTQLYKLFTKVPKPWVPHQDLGQAEVYKALL